MSPGKDTQKPARKRTANAEKSGGFTDDERAAMRERARERKAEAGPGARADAANLDEGAMWPTSCAIETLTVSGEARIGALVKKGVR